MRQWLDGFVRWAGLVACMFVIGPLASLPLTGLRDVEGGQAVTVLLNATPVMGLAVLLVLMGVACVCGVIGARWFSLGWGFAYSGFVLVWGAWRLGTSESLVRRAQRAPGWTLVLEGAIVMALTVLLAWLLVGIARKQQRSPAPKAKEAERLPMIVSAPHAGASQVLGVSSVVALLFGAVACWLVAISPLKGQVVFAALAGGVAGALAAQFVASGNRASISPLVPIVALAIAAVAGPAASFAAAGNQAVAKVYANTIFPLAHVLPLDWAAGLVLGVPLGFSWAGAMLDDRAEEDRETSA
jgi:hypothetical protein